MMQSVTQSIMQSMVMPFFVSQMWAGMARGLRCSVETGVDKFARGVTELLSLPGLKLAPILMQKLNANLMNLFVQSTGFFDSGAVLYWFTFMQLSFFSIARSMPVADIACLGL